MLKGEASCKESWNRVHVSFLRIGEEVYSEIHYRRAPARKATAIACARVSMALYLASQNPGAITDIVGLDPRRHHRTFHSRNYHSNACPVGNKGEEAGMYTCN